jgi:hydroxyacylglutathione hydrolase
MSTNMTQIRDDLWQTRTESPFPGLTTHAYLWRGPAGNILFYSPASEADFDDIEALGGVSAQYLSHLDEAGPVLARVSDRFGSRLHAPAEELEAIGRHAHVDVPVEARRHVDANGVGAIPTPGHSDGSTCYLVTGVGGEEYLFTATRCFRPATAPGRRFLCPAEAAPQS